MQLALYFLLCFPVIVITAIDVSSCQCGFQDPSTSEVFTEALIYYFNETDLIDPSIFAIQDFAHKKEQGWNAIYRQGALPQNAQIVNDSMAGVQALQLQVQPSTSNHLVNGASLESVRQDIQSGSFQAGLRPASQWMGGTALTFKLAYNASQSLEVDMLNTDESTSAGVTMLVNGEWPDPKLTANFTTLSSSSPEAWQNLWQAYTDVRMDWNATSVEFFIADNLTRAVMETDRTLPVAGQALQLTAWSTGDKTWMQGPPISNASKTHVLYVRSFFNASTMTAAEHDAYDARCATVTERCDIADTTLRGSTPYSLASTVKWKPPPISQGLRRNAGIVAGCCSSFGIFALINIFLRRTPWARLNPSRKAKQKALRKAVRNSLHREKAPVDHEVSTNGRPMSAWASYASSTIQTPLPAYGAASIRSGSQTPAPAYSTPPHVVHKSVSLASLQKLEGAAADQSTENATSRSSNDDEITRLSRIAEKHESLLFEKTASPTESLNEDSTSPAESLSQKTKSEKDSLSERDSISITIAGPRYSTIGFEKQETSNTTDLAASPDKGKQVSSTTTDINTTGPETKTPTTTVLPIPITAAKTKRIDYLAGLVSLACLGVSLHHFAQTFWPYVADGYGPGAHYPQAEKYLSKIIGSYLLTQLWIGPFFLTATRFLTSNYLKNGKLEDIAKKELRRAPRLFVPILIISLLQYFLISMGVTGALPYLPSVSWSTWPYVVPQPNFGVWMNNMVELAYAFPNVIPEVVQHYCIGVLWTVPIQLQFTYVVLIAAVMIRDIKRPYKRFGFYFLVILAGWYAKSWSACHWAGLLLSDLEATYKWKVWLSKRPFARYGITTAAFICVAISTSAGAMNQTWSFETLENGIHPDSATGKPIAKVDPTYPNYNEPTLSILVFSIGLQILVELSTGVQAVLSWQIFLWLQPHAMTIYLTHGFVMWSWGAWCAVALSLAGVPYWANLLVTLVTTYAWLGLLASVLTPLMEHPTQATLRAIDRWVRDEPVPKRRTTAPFGKELVDGRGVVESGTGA